MQKCHRCKQETISVKMSWFNTQMICKACQKEEEQHDDFHHAKLTVLFEEAHNNRNYEGIGLPEDLKQKYPN